VGERREMQEALFYGFSLKRHVADGQNQPQQTFAASGMSGLVTNAFG
jgi:hypothetical protein